MVQQIQSIPESGIPDRLLDDARAIVVVPDTIKAGFLIGGRRGLGLMSVNGRMRSPRPAARIRALMRCQCRGRP